MISILMATYNGEAYLTEQIESLLQQTMQDFTLYIRDDCSDDGTFAVAQAYQQRYPGRIIARQLSRNSGSARHNFFGMMLEHRDEYIMLCDQDDVWLPEKIEKTMVTMRGMEDRYGQGVPILVHTNLAIVNEQLHLLHPSFAKAMNADYSRKELRDLIIQNTLTGCTAMYNRSTAELLDTLPDNAVMHDWWLALVVSAFGRIGHIDDQTILYRQHQHNQVGANVQHLPYIFHRLTHPQEIVNAIYQTYPQAEDFLRIYRNRLSAEQVELLEAYCAIPLLSKLDRIRTILRYGTLKSGFLRNVAHFLFV